MATVAVTATVGLQQSPANQPLIRPRTHAMEDQDQDGANNDAGSRGQGAAVVAKMAPKDMAKLGSGEGQSAGSHRTHRIFAAVNDSWMRFAAL